MANEVLNQMFVDLQSTQYCNSKR